MKKNQRTLYECFNAKVNSERIYCSKGYPLAKEQTTLEPVHLERGEKLAIKICRQCSDFDSMGAPVPKEERGWLKIKEATKHDGTYRKVIREAVA